MKVDQLTPLQAEVALARSLGYHIRYKNRPYVMIDDWCKEGTVVDGCRFEPITDEYQHNKLARIAGVKCLQQNDKWTAGVLTDLLKVSTYTAATRGEAIVRCILQYTFPNFVPDWALQENTL